MPQTTYISAGDRTPVLTQSGKPHCCYHAHELQRQRRTTKNTIWNLWLALVHCIPKKLYCFDMDVHQRCGSHKERRWDAIRGRKTYCVQCVHVTSFALSTWLPQLQWSKWHLWQPVETTIERMGNLIHLAWTQCDCACMHQRKHKQWHI